MLPNYIQKLIEEARQSGQAVTIQHLVKQAALNQIPLDEAVKTLRKALNNQDVDAELIGKDVLLLTHKNEMQVHIEAALQEEFLRRAEEAVEEANVLYRELAKKPLTAEQTQELKQAVIAEQTKAMTPFDGMNEMKPNPYR